MTMRQAIQKSVHSTFASVFLQIIFYMNRFSKSHCEYNAKAWSLKCGSESSNIHTKRATSFPIPALIT